MVHTSVNLMALFKIEIVIQLMSKMDETAEAIFKMYCKKEAKKLMSENR